MNIIEKIGKIAGPQRAESFTAAAQWILEHPPVCMAETGCYRGIDGDGNSTLILATLAQEIGAEFISIDNNPDHLAAAKKMLAECLPSFTPFGPIGFTLSDSVLALRDFALHDGPQKRIGFLYLDSYDHEPANPKPCQIHQLAEITSVYPALCPTCAVLMDDVDRITGGKTALSGSFLSIVHWHLQEFPLQLLFTR